jgi:co-chaperonin GroES (HSP10)
MEEALQIEPIVVHPIPEPDKIEGVLKAVGYRILVHILPLEETAQRFKDSKLVMPPETHDRELMAQTWGEVLDMGTDAYRDKTKFPTGPWCKKGDRIFMRPYSGTRFVVRGELYALINDDTVQGVVTGDPGEIERP